jgi:hypothetical protein
LDRAVYLEELKLYHRKIEGYDKNAPKLYGLILQFLSDESLEAVKKDEGWETIEADADPEGLWKVIVQKHKVHSASEVGQIVKLSTRQLYCSMRQGSFESIISYKERFNSALAAYKDQGNPNMQDEDIALDFFSGLDNARYADIKADFLNGLTGGAIEAPECFNCVGDHYIKDCPELKRNKSNNNSDYGGMAAITVEATTFMTYQVNAVSYTRFKDTKLLLDNQANICVMKPRLLHQIERATEEVKINGVGDLQLCAKETSYLNDFFRVYASEEMKANVLSFADVEDMYDITYVRGESFIVHLPEKNLEFTRKGKLYVADFVKERLVHATQVTTKGEEARAKQAYELVKNLGFPSMYEAIQVIESGSLGNMPLLTGEDIRRAYRLFGPPVGFV